MHNLPLIQGKYGILPFPDDSPMTETDDMEPHRLGAKAMEATTLGGRAKGAPLQGVINKRVRGTDIG